MSEPQPHPPDAEERLDAVIAQYLEGHGAGAPQARQELLDRHPDLADGLRKFFADLDGFTALTVPLRPARPPGRDNGKTLTPSALRDLPTINQDAAPGCGVLFEGGSFAGYDDLREIATGGMGVVFRAVQRVPPRPVALKMIRSGQFAAKADVERFHLEVEAIAGLDHPHIVPIHEVGEHLGVHYFSMKLMEGGSLSKRVPYLKDHPREAAELLIKVARAVHFAHQRGILHRDLKPDNILLDGQGQPHVSDFGLAKRIAADTSLSPSGTIVGTPGYMPPEQARGQRDLTTAADVYSLGAILYHLLTGRAPFQAETALDTLLLLLDQEPPPPRTLNPAVARDLETICLKCLAKDPGRRYGSAEDVARELERWLRHEPIRGRRVGPGERFLKWVRRQPWVAGLLGLVVLVTVVGFVAVVSMWRVEARVARELAGTLYYQTIALAERELAANNLGRAAEMLDGPLCPEGLRGWEWYYLRRLTHPNAPVLRGHTGAIFCLACSPDGKLLASGSGDNGEGEVKVWDLDSGTEVRTLGRGRHKSLVRGVAFSPDRKLLATASADHTVILWDTTDWKPVRVLEGHKVLLWCVAFSPDGTRLASGGGDRAVNGDGEIMLWDVATGEPLHTIARPGDRIWRLTFSPDGKRFASAGEDHRVHFWDVATAREVGTLPPHRAPALNVQFSRNGRLLATSSGAHHRADPGEVKIWDAATGKLLFDLRGHTDEVWGLSFSPDGRRLASSSHDQTVKVWDTATGKEALTLRGHRDNIRAVTFSPDGNRLLSASEDQTIRVCERLSSTGHPYATEGFTLQGHTDRVWCSAYSPDGQRLASAAEDGTVRLWQVGTGRLTQTLTGHKKGVRWVTFDPQGRRLASASYDNTVKVWDPETGQALTLTAPATGWVHGAAFSPDGLLVAGVSNYTVRVWDAGSGAEVRTRAPEHDWVVNSVAFRPGLPAGVRELATGGWDQAIRLWDLNRPEAATSLRGHQGHKGRVRCIAFRPDGKVLASASNDGTVKLWDVARGQVLRTLSGHLNAVIAVSFSGDGKRLASASQDQTVKVWDAAGGAELLSLRGHTGQVRGVAFRPDGRQLAVSSGDTGQGEVKLWDLELPATPADRGR